MNGYDYTGNHSNWFKKAGYTVCGIGEGFGRSSLRLHGKEVAQFSTHAPIHVIEGMAKLHLQKREILGHILRVALDESRASIFSAQKLGGRFAPHMERLTADEKSIVRLLLRVGASSGKKNGPYLTQFAFDI